MDARARPLTDLLESHHSVTREYVSRIVHSSSFVWRFGGGDVQVADATLEHCFTWVGVLEELPHSLDALKRALPRYFAALAVDQEIAVLAAEGGQKRSGPAHNLQRERTMLQQTYGDRLRDEELVYERARSRLLRSAGVRFRRLISS